MRTLVSGQLRNGRDFSATTGRWLLVICVLLGLFGQLALQSQSMPDETPRATFERLTGLSIGPDTPPAPSEVMMMSMGHTGMLGMAHHSGHHHHHDAACPLCPLLHLPAVVLLATVLVLLTLIRWSRWCYRSHAVRAPPVGRVTHLPPATGPPHFV
ncbi:DUF2946 family protein [Gluconobacter japonicus]|uniref:DUF2946 domain-containing protein n=1 Tax=Gluconobacter japonicus TaxID=376620 RepID=A0ABQ5WFX5_GLUJA|nr:DUF2946 family protein [Gluconobacter japonicus]GLQ58669.1 hypothetical protein GCM10010937_04710 [Gluconobacter japonicus]